MLSSTLGLIDRRALGLEIVGQGFGPGGYLCPGLGRVDPLGNAAQDDGVPQLGRSIRCRQGEEVDDPAVNRA